MIRTVIIPVTGSLRSAAANRTRLSCGRMIAAQLLSFWNCEHWKDLPMPVTENKNAAEPSVGTGQCTDDHRRFCQDLILSAFRSNHNAALAVLVLSHRHSRPSKRLERIVFCDVRFTESIDKRTTEFDIWCVRQA